MMVAPKDASTYCKTTYTVTLTSVSIHHIPGPNDGSPYEQK